MVVWVYDCLYPSPVLRLHSLASLAPVTWPQPSSLHIVLCMHKWSDRVGWVGGLCPSWLSPHLRPTASPLSNTTHNHYLCPIHGAEMRNLSLSDQRREHEGWAEQGGPALKTEVPGGTRSCMWPTQDVVSKVGAERMTRTQTGQP